MPEDVTKMKVADLKRELKLRGLTTTGNKNELQDRLQTALIDGDGDELLEDAAMSGEELLTDEEDEAKILGADENELLKSPTTTPTVPDLSLKTGAATTEDDILESPTTTATKKIVLKRKNSFSANNGSGGGGASTISSITGSTLAPKAAGEDNEEPTVPKVSKMSERNPITMGSNKPAATIAAASNITSAAASTAAKVSQLTLKERMEMRAKKFGVAATKSSDKTNATVAASAAGAAAATATVATVSDEKQMELLKKRAERFGVVSSKMVEIDAKEKLLKRQERFGGTTSTTTTTGSGATTNGKTGEWAEKARLRLERFKTATPTIAKAAAATPAGSN